MEAFRGHGLVVSQVVRHESAKVDIVLTDMVMPRMSGPELAKRLTALQPAIRILYVSGHVGDPTVLEAMGKGSRDFLQKPFSGSVPARKIMELINRPKV
jgi:FixJ family two-component response regulator